MNQHFDTTPAAYQPPAALRTASLAAIETDSMVLTVRGLGGRVNHQFGEPGIVIATALSRTGAGLILVKELLDCNQGQSASCAASYLSTVVVHRLQLLHPNVSTNMLRWFDMTREDRPVEWLVNPAVRPCTVGMFEAVLANAITPPRPQASLRDIKALPTYREAAAALSAGTVRASMLY